MERDSVVIYRSYIEAAAVLNNKADRADFYEAVFRYAFDGIEVELKPLLKAMFILVKPQIDANNKRYIDGKKGGRPPKTEPVKHEKREKMIEKLEESIRLGANSVSYDK